MIRFTNTVEIDRARDEVFAYLGDLEHTPEWNWAIEETRKIGDGPVGVGTEYHQTRSVPSSSTETLRITGFVPGEHLAVEGRLGPFGARVRYDLAGDGPTTVTNTVQLDPPGILQLASPILRRRIEQSVAENLGVLKRRLEGLPPAAAVTRRAAAASRR